MTPEIRDIYKELEEQRQAKEKSAASKAKELFLLLAIANIAAVEITFDGSGDSGSIEEILAREVGSDKWAALPTLFAEVETWAYDLLEGTGVDWYNNDGGFGTISMCIEDKKFSYSVNQRFISSEVAASGEVTLDESVLP